LHLNFIKKKSGLISGALNVKYRADLPGLVALEMISSNSVDFTNMIITLLSAIMY
jgi:hypothetical protein